MSATNPATAISAAAPVSPESWQMRVWAVERAIEIVSDRPRPDADAVVRTAEVLASYVQGTESVPSKGPGR